MVIRFLPPVTPQVHLPASLPGTHGASHLLHRRAPDAVAEPVDGLPLRLLSRAARLVPACFTQLATVRGDAIAAADVEVAGCCRVLDRQAGEVVAGVGRGPVVGEEVLDLDVVRVGHRDLLHLGVVGGGSVVVLVRVHVVRGQGELVPAQWWGHGVVTAGVRALARAAFPAAADLEEALLLEYAADHPSVLLHGQRTIMSAQSLRTY
jgi:hypothetical protein